MTEQTVWQPVEDGEYPSLTLTKRVIVIGGLLGIVGKSGGFCIALPDSLRLCRCVPAPQVSVPVEIADILRPLVDEVHWARYGSEDDEQRAALVRDWLDSQRPAPGQE